MLVKQQLEMQAAESRSQLYLAKQRKREAYSRLEAVKLQLQCVQNKLMEQLVQLHKAESAECEASACAGQLEMYVRDWRAAAQVIHKHSASLELIIAHLFLYFSFF